VIEATFLAALLVVFVAGGVSGLAGFGFALVVVTPLLLLYDPPIVVTLSIVLTLVTNWIVIVGAVAAIQRRTVLALLPGACIGLAIGAQLLRALDASAIELIAGVVVVTFTVMLMAGLNLPGAESKAAVGLSGLISGVLGTSTGISGPPVVTLFIARRFSPQAFRVSIATYLLAIDAIGFAILIGQGTVRIEQLRVALALLPAAILGTLAGRRLAGRISPELFRRLTLVLLLVTGIVGTVNALVNLLA
jgi:uncharacterized protein